MVANRPSPWLVDRFGDRVAQVRTRVVDGLTEAQASRQLSQEAAGIRTAHAYGGAWPAVFTKLAAQFRDADQLDVGFTKPYGAPYELPVVNKVVLIPFRHSTTLSDPVVDAMITSRHQLDLLDSLDALTPPSPTLFDEHPDLAPPNTRNVTRLESGMSAVLVPFVANADSQGLLALWWGTATVHDTGEIDWVELEQIPLTTPENSAASGPADPTIDLGFTVDEIPGLNVSPRRRPATENPGTPVEPPVTPRIAHDIDE